MKFLLHLVRRIERTQNVSFFFFLTRLVITNVVFLKECWFYCVLILDLWLYSFSLQCSTYILLVPLLLNSCIVKNHFPFVIKQINPNLSSPYAEKIIELNESLTECENQILICGRSVSNRETEHLVTAPLKHLFCGLSLLRVWEW